MTDATGRGDARALLVARPNPARIASAERLSLLTSWTATTDA